jgi:hypothetical protein
VTFWYCSGFTYQYFWLMDPDSALTPDPDPGIFLNDLKDWD